MFEWSCQLSKTHEEKFHFSHEEIIEEYFIMQLFKVKIICSYKCEKRGK